MTDWKPGATQSVRVARNQLYQQIRQFFHNKSFIEVDPPLIGRSGTTDPHIHSFTIASQSAPAIDYYLQTSPEFFMKRLLAAGSGPIYALTKSFRQKEQGRLHNPEFTILEWYQPGLDDHQLMEQVSEFFKALLDLELTRVSYRDCFLRTFSVNPHCVDLQDLEAIGHSRLNVDWRDTERDTWLEALFSHVIQPTLKQGTIVYDYPASQAALAKITKNKQGESIARRFEVFANGLELGNGYWELTDGEEQQNRFDSDNDKRVAMDLDQVVVDQKLVSALDAGLPSCAGIAFGVDRLLMLQLGLQGLDEVMDFSHDRL